MQQVQGEGQMVAMTLSSADDALILDQSATAEDCKMVQDFMRLVAVALERLIP